MEADREVRFCFWARYRPGMSVGDSDYILVWMRDRSQATELCEAFERSGLNALWAASLPEAINTLDRCFPRAVACSLDCDAPALIDLETLLTYLTIGHDSVSLPPIPIWAATARPALYSTRIDALQLPIQLVAADMGPEGLAAEVVHQLQSQGWLRRPVADDTLSVLYMSPDPRVGFYLSRYLGARNIPTLSLQTIDEAFVVLEGGAFRVLVADLPEEESGRVFLKRVKWRWSELPLVLLGDERGWLTRLTPRELPAKLFCMLPKPVRAETLETCLRRLLRIPTAPTDHLAAGMDAPPVG